MEYIWNVLNYICLWIDGFLYSFISFLYQVFIVISKANLFTETTLRTFTDRVFIILGIVMLFYIAYEILVLIVSPDKVSGENQAKTIVSKLVKSIIIIILLPTIFKYMQIFQNNILSSNVIGNIILGSSSGSAPDNSLKTAGTSMALSIGQAFYHPVDSTGKEYSYLDCKIEDNETKVPACANFVEAYDKALENNTPGIFFGDSNLKKQLHLNPWEQLVDSKREMIYYAILSTISAVLAIQMIVAFALDIGIRVAKLGFLQIIAPIPIAQNITQKESLSQTGWFKSLVETYLEIFMKLIIIYFSMFAITLVPEVIENIFYRNQSDTGTLVKMLATVVIILGILQFAKTAPELIKNLFNIKDFGNGISIRKRLEDNTYAQRGAAMLGGAGGSAISNVAHGWNNIKNAQGVKGKIGAGLLGAGSTIGGLFDGGYRGFRNSEGMTSWGQLKDGINRTRAESDAARTAFETKNQAAREMADDKFGNRVPLGAVVGRFPLAVDDLLDFSQRSKDWVKGGVNKEKLEAARTANSAIEKLYSTYQGSDAKGWDDTMQKQLDNFRQGKEVLGIYKINDDGDITNERPDNINEQVIKDYYKAMKIKSQITSFTSEDNRQYVQRTGEDLVKILQKSLNTLGPEAIQKVFESTGITSMSEINKIFEDIGSGNLSMDNGRKLDKLKNAMDNQSKFQQQLLESKENNK